MAEADRAEAQIYQLRAVIRGISPMIWRRLLVRDDSTVAQLHEVLPRVFAEMPGGRLIGTLFFILLVLAALMPSVALLEPAVAWLIQRLGLGRTSAVCLIALAVWVLGLGSVLSFSWWSGWHPLASIPIFANKTFLTSSTICLRTS
jgi:SNF family Na+-dependent transporter